MVVKYECYTVIIARVDVMILFIYYLNLYAALPNVASLRVAQTD